MALLDLLAQHRQQIISIVDECGGTNIRVYGSVARREEADDSDVDLLIDIKPERQGLNLNILMAGVGAIQGELKSLLNREVHVHVEEWLSLKIRRSIRQSIVIAL